MARLPVRRVRGSPSEIPRILRRRYGCLEQTKKSAQVHERPDYGYSVDECCCLWDPYWTRYVQSDKRHPFVRVIYLGARSGLLTILSTRARHSIAAPRGWNPRFPPACPLPRGVDPGRFALPRRSQHSVVEWRASYSNQARSLRRVTSTGSLVVRVLLDGQLPPSRVLSPIRDAYQLDSAPCQQCHPTF